MSVCEHKKLENSIIGLVDERGKKVWRYRGGTLDFPYDKFTSLASFEKFIESNKESQEETE